MKKIIKSELKGNREIRKEEKMDVIEVEQVCEQEKETRKSLKLLDQNVIKGNNEEHDGIRTRTEGKWKKSSQINPKGESNEVY